MLICLDTVHLFTILSKKGINLINEIENATHFDKCYILTITLCWCEASVVMLLSQASIWLDWLQLLGRYISVCFQHIMLSWGPAHWAVGLATTVVGTHYPVHRSVHSDPSNMGPMFICSWGNCILYTITDVRQFYNR